MKHLARFTSAVAILNLAACVAAPVDERDDELELESADISDDANDPATFLNAPSDGERYTASYGLECESCHSGLETTAAASACKDDEGITLEPAPIDPDSDE